MPSSPRPLAEQRWLATHPANDDDWTAQRLREEGAKRRAEAEALWINRAAPVAPVVRPPGVPGWALFVGAVIVFAVAVWGCF
jgi:ferric-dicitrate binding protein FerR (iron transport regulator)